jgi:hypothetical protein
MCILSCHLNELVFHILQIMKRSHEKGKERIEKLFGNSTESGASNLLGTVLFTVYNKSIL